VLDGLDVEAAFEPGRLLAANAGVLLSRVIQITERADGRRFLVLDAAMNDLIRPAMYDSFHEVQPVRPRPLGGHNAPTPMTSSARSARPATPSPATATCRRCRRAIWSSSPAPEPMAR
jgi:hypothetical protein